MHWQFVEGDALGIGGLDHLLDEVDRQAGDIAAGFAAQLRQPVGRGFGADVPRDGK